MVIYTNEFLYEIIKNWLVKTQLAGFSILNPSPSQVLKIESDSNAVYVKTDAYSSHPLVKIFVSDNESIVIQLIHYAGGSWRATCRIGKADIIKSMINQLIAACQQLEQELETFDILKDVHLKV